MIGEVLPFICFFSDLSVVITTFSEPFGSLALGLVLDAIGCLLFVLFEVCGSGSAFPNALKTFSSFSACSFSSVLAPARLFLLCSFQA